MKKTADHWFLEYGEAHHHRVNEIIHWICVPAITLSLLGLLWSIPLPVRFAAIAPYINVATLFVAVATAFYLRLSWPLAAGMLLFTAAAMAIIIGFARSQLAPVWAVSLAIFAVAWVLQFLGHKLEGKKPAFFQDIQFLLIGPIWLLGFIYRRLGIPY